MGQLKRYQVIIFDWDGTLMDSDKRIVACLKEAARRADLPLLTDRAYKQFIGLSLSMLIQRLYPDASDWQRNVMDAAYRWQFMEANDEPMMPFDGLSQLLDSLKSQGFKLAIATGKSRKGLDLALSEAGVIDFFDITKSAEETACKPDPLMLHEILQELSLPVSSALMVGDSIFDLEMAQRIGMDAVAMTHGVHEPDQLRLFNPVAICHNLDELNRWITGNR